ncbi:discoidin domain-containing protein [Paenibacillus xerothermodurans]|uniref:F5/8 type C domain-containing protein n=1 Tax=Paenibacillus xerothermodurans TaxID=1977292 RepID=A0A2W1NCD2_PAEXE|nr:discoidin domain-containing protein [Paenibacillus xerothermodurans]PZE22137.1 hypothetical protein CBW46_007065 [Paenibacillus xerothermodurans]
MKRFIKQRLSVLLSSAIIAQAFALPGEIHASSIESPFNDIVPVSVTDSSNDGNIPANAIDHNRATKWGTSIPGNWLQFDLGEPKQIGYLGMAFYIGDARPSKFDILVSNDGHSWQNVLTGQSSGTTNDIEPFKLAEPVEARYVRISGNGNTKSTYSGITEVQIYAPTSDGSTPVVSVPSFDPPKPEGYQPFTKAGMYNADGSVHAVHTPNAVTGRTINVTDFNVNLADNDTDDTKGIQAAIAAAQPGDEVYLPDGVYNLTASTDDYANTYNILLKSGVNFRGQSEQGTVLKTTLDKIKGSTVLKAPSLNNILISDLMITSTWNKAFPTTTSKNNPDAGGPDNAITIVNVGEQPAYNITVDNVTMERYMRVGVKVDSSRDIVVRNCLFRDTTDAGGGGTGYGMNFQGRPKVDRTGFKDDAVWNLAENNTFQGPHLRHGVLVQYMQHNSVIRNNTFKDIWLDAIDLHGEGEYLNEITGNVITNIRSGAGIGLGNTGGTAPYDHSASGHGNLIRNNIITESNDGVTVTMGTPGTVIENNVIKQSDDDNGSGITVQNGPGTIIRGNEISGSPVTGFWGIQLKHDNGDKNAGYIGKGDPKDVQIVYNLIVDNDNGIDVQAGTGIVLKNNYLKNATKDYNKGASADVREEWPLATPLPPTVVSADITSDGHEFIGDVVLSAPKFMRVDLYANDKVIGSVYGLGQPDLIIPVRLANGDYTLTAAAVDPFGHVSKTIAVTQLERAKSANAHLSSLTVKSDKKYGTHEVDFNIDTTEYRVQVDEPDNKLVVNAVTADSKAKLFIDGREQPSGQDVALEKLKKGDNAFKIQVKAENGQVKTYTLIVRRK